MDRDKEPDQAGGKEESEATRPARDYFSPAGDKDLTARRFCSPRVGLRHRPSGPVNPSSRLSLRATFSAAQALAPAPAPALGQINASLELIQPHQPCPGDRKHPPLWDLMGPVGRGHVPPLLAPSPSPVPGSALPLTH